MGESLTNFCAHGNMQKSNSIGHFCKKFILHKFDPFALHNSHISRFEHHIWVKYFSHWSQFPTLQSPRKCGIQTLIELNWNYPRTISITFCKSLILHLAIGGEHRGGLANCCKTNFRVGNCWKLWFIYSYDEIYVCLNCVKTRFEVFSEMLQIILTSKQCGGYAISSFCILHPRESQKN